MAEFLIVPLDLREGGAPAGWDWVPLVGSRWTDGGQVNSGSQVVTVNTAWSSPSGNTFRANVDIGNANGAAEGYTWFVDATETLADIGLEPDDVLNGSWEVAFFTRSNNAPASGQIMTVGWNVVNTALTTAVGMSGDNSPIGNVQATVQNGANNSASSVNASSSILWSAGGVLGIPLVTGGALTQTSLLVPDAPASSTRNYVSNGPYDDGAFTPGAAFYLGINLGKGGTGTHTMDGDVSVWIAKRIGQNFTGPS